MRSDRESFRGSFGIESLDAMLDGIRPGDNIVWITDRTPRYAAIERCFVEASLAAGLPVIDVVTGQGDLARERPAGVEIVDATSGSRASRPVALTDEIERRLAISPGAAFVIDGLSALVRRWGEERALAFFARMCPTMLQTGALTFWRAAPTTDADLVESVRQVTQCLLELHDAQLRIVKAEGRPHAAQGTVYRVELHDGAISAVADPAAGRLARGLQSVRRDLGLTQSYLADIAGVTPSAISQAESGRRGLALNTLIVLSEALGVSLDRLVGAPAP
ncbi:MAG TPA: helix-turn-helix transcriptional regulator, partial [Ilumatobacteraceae bacterium]|nr:helix-turn-helix transcriptional regulator [Ilumatobacteraceae bacterium]